MIMAVSAFRLLFAAVLISIAAMMGGCVFFQLLWPIDVTAPDSTPTATPESAPTPSTPPTPKPTHTPEPAPEPIPTLQALREHGSIVINGERSLCEVARALGTHAHRQANFIQWRPGHAGSLLFDLDETKSHSEAIWTLNTGGQGIPSKVAEVNSYPGVNSAFGFYADWSPDGSRVVHSTCEYRDMDSHPGSTRFDGEGWPTYELALGGGDNASRLTDNDAYENFPSWSPDGTKIAFLSRPPFGSARQYTPRQGQVGVMPADPPRSSEVEWYGNWTAPYPPRLVT